MILLLPDFISDFMLLRHKQLWRLQSFPISADRSCINYTENSCLGPLPRCLLSEPTCTEKDLATLRWYLGTKTNIWNRDIPCSDTTFKTELRMPFKFWWQTLNWLINWFCLLGQWVNNMKFHSPVWLGPWE